MIYRQLGDSDVEVPVVVFGAWAIGGWWWGGSDDEQAIQAINRAAELGVNCIDTAPMYGFGHSEEVVGKAIKGRRDEFTIATKCGLVWDRTDGQRFFDTEESPGQHTVYRCLKKDNILRECDMSLRRLGVDVIDIYQCHWMDDTTPLSETMEALVELYEAGKIRAIGMSNFTAEAIEECLSYGPVHSHQPKFSLLDRQHLGGVIDYTRHKNIGTVVYSTLEQGMLTGKVTVDRTFAQGDKRVNQPWFKLENRRRALEVLQRDIQPIADAHGATLAQTAIAWTLSAPGITSALVGARNPLQAQENAAAADIALSDEEYDSILAAFESLGAPA